MEIKMAASESSKVSQPQQNDAEPVQLSDLLDRGWKLYEEVDGTSEPTGTNDIQNKVKRGMKQLEEASVMVALLDIFSSNEDLEDVATIDLKYLMLPALLGGLTMKQVDQSKRLEHVQMARIYFLDFLRRCKEYNLSKFDLPKTEMEDSPGTSTESGLTSSPRPPDLLAMATQRQAKLERYKQKKETEAKLSDIKAAVESGQADEEIIRDFYLLNIRKWIALSLEEIESIDQEIMILKRMGVLKQSSSEPCQSKTRAPVKPFILTKDAVQARVFGAGYPSLPTMTVDDWYEQHSKHGGLPDQGIPHSAVELDGEECEKEEKEKLAENDDEGALQKARDWDNWKDTHRRGYGNRKNMG